MLVGETVTAQSHGMSIAVVCRRFTGATTERLGLAAGAPTGQAAVAGLLAGRFRAG